MYKEVQGYYMQGVGSRFLNMRSDVAFLADFCSSKCLTMVSEIVLTHTRTKRAAGGREGLRAALMMTVTTLFADDNWGNIRALLPFNHTRKGGGGIYYHADCTYLLSIRGFRGARLAFTAG